MNRKKKPQPLAQYAPPEPAPLVSTSIDADRLMQSFLKGRKPTTIEAYKKDLSYFAEFCKLPDSTTASAQLIKMNHGQANMVALDFRNDMIEKNLAPKTINRRLSALRSICSLANRFGIVPWQLSVQGVKDERRKQPNPPSVDEINGVLQAAAAQGNERKRVRDVALVTLAYTGAFRRKEILSADFSELDLERGCFRITGKGKSEKETIDISSIAIECLRKWIALRGNAPGPVFFNQRGKPLTGRGVYHIIQNLGAKVGLSLHPHALRHAFVTNNYNAGVRMPDIQAVTRHVNEKTLQGYLTIKRETAKKISERTGGDIRLEAPAPEKKKRRKKK